MFPSLEDTTSDSPETEKWWSHLHRKSKQAEGRPYKNDSPLRTHFSKRSHKKGTSITYSPAVLYGDTKKTSISKSISFNCPGRNSELTS